MKNFTQKKLINKKLEVIIFNQIKNVIDETDLKTFNENVNFYDIMDSLDSVSIIMNLEKELDIQILDDDAEKMTSLKESLKILREKYVVDSVYQRKEKLKKINGRK